MFSFNLYYSSVWIFAEQLSFSCAYCRMTHPGRGLPSSLTQDMFEGGNQWTTQEGLGLKLSRKLLRRMNGQVHYIKEHNRCYFLIDLKFKTSKEREGSLAGTSRMAS